MLTPISSTANVHQNQSRSRDFSACGRKEDTQARLGKKEKIGNHKITK